MMFRRKLSTAAALLILMMSLSRGRSLTCLQAEYQIGNECCPMCLPGSRVRRDCTEFSSTSCLPCTEGTFMNQPTGLKQCFSCTNCDAGSGLKIKTSCRPTSDTVCEPLEGFYCLDPTENGCQAAQRHKSCQPGQYISHKGTASTDTVCSDCSEGTFSDGTFTSCRPHTQCDSVKPQLIKPGTVSSDAECGENSLVTGIVIGVVGIILLTGAAVSVWFFLAKKKGCMYKGESRNVNSSTPARQNGEEKAELPLDRHQRQQEEAFYMETCRQHLEPLESMSSPESRIWI